MSVDLMKAEAKRLRAAISEMFSVSVSHSQSLELIAKAKNYKDWNTASAMANTTAPAPIPQPGYFAGQSPLKLDRATDIVRQCFDLGYTKVQFECTDKNVHITMGDDFVLSGQQNIFRDLSYPIVPDDPVVSFEFADNISFRHPVYGFFLNYRVSRYPNSSGRTYILSLAHQAVPDTEDVFTLLSPMIKSGAFIMINGNDSEITFWTLHTLLNRLTEQYGRDGTFAMLPCLRTAMRPTLTAAFPPKYIEYPFDIAQPASFTQQMDTAAERAFRARHDGLAVDHPDSTRTIHVLMDTANLGGVSLMTLDKPSPFKFIESFGVQFSENVPVVLVSACHGAYRVFIQKPQ